jgi:hypothetical protein
MKWFGVLLSILTFIFSSFLLVSCADEEEEVIETPLVCSLPNGMLKWTADGTERCANASLFGDYGIFLTVNGVSTQGQTLTLELDSLSVGTYELSADENYMLYTDNFAMVWEATNEQPGTITITGHNETTNQLNATFQINLVNPLNGQIKAITNGQLNIKYTE